MIVKIQNRRGGYTDYDPSKLLPGEFAIVQMGDPNTATGNGIYLAITTGNVVRLATIEEIQTYTQQCQDIYQSTVQDAGQLLDIARSMLANYDGGLVVVDSISSMRDSNTLYLYSGSGQYQNYVYRYDSAQQIFVPIVEFGSVIDASLTESKFSESLKAKTIKDYVTPELYGAKGDGITDDTAAIQLCIDSNPGKTVVFSKTYVVSASIQTSAADSDKVMLVGVNGGKITAARNFSGSVVVDLCGKGTRTGIQNTKNITGVDGLIIDTNGKCGGILVERCCEARISNCTITNLGAYIGLQIDKPSESDGVNSSDAYIDNVIVLGESSNVAECTGMVINGHDNDIRNIRTNYVNIGIVINGSHNRIANAHPLRGAADNNFAIYQTSKAFVINNNFIYLTNCYSDNFAVGVDVAKAGAIFFLTNFTLLWWENLNTIHTFIKLEDDQEATAATKIFWGHISGADLLFKTNGTNTGIDGVFHANTYIRNPNCITGLYIDGLTISATDALFDKRLSTNKINDYNYTPTEISDLSTINEGTCGRVRFTAAVSPTGTTGIYIYECVGDSTRKIITAYYPSNKKQYINSYTGSWTGWEEVAKQTDVATNATAIATNASNIATNTSAIATNTSDISTINGTLTNLTGSQSAGVSSANFNSLTTSGAYQIGDLSTMTNGPTSSGYGVLEVVKARSYIVQRFIANGPNVYVRMSSNSGSTWSSWKTL